MALAAPLPGPFSGTLPLVLAALAGACTPALNWRELELAKGQVRAMLPCRPAQAEREVPLAGAPAAMSLQSCEADGALWALAAADVKEPARVGPTLMQLREHAAQQLRAGSAATLPLSVAGATPQPNSGRLAHRGQLASGAATQQQMALFAYGTWVVQATVMAPAIDAAAADTFFGALRVKPR